MNGYQPLDAFDSDMWQVNNTTSMEMPAANMLDFTEQMPDIQVDVYTWNNLYLSRQWHFLRQHLLSGSGNQNQGSSTSIDEAIVLLRKLQDCVSHCAVVARCLGNQELAAHYMAGLDRVTEDLREFLDLTKRGLDPKYQETSDSI